MKKSKICKRKLAAALWNLLALFLALLQPLPCLSQQLSSHDQQALKEWRAGAKVSLAAVEKFGNDKCFAIEKISDKVFKRMWRKSYKANCTTPRSSLRYLKVLHYNANGDILIGEMVCNKAVSDDLLAIFKALFDAKYPIERMVLVDEYDADDEASMRANNTSCFNFRTATGSKKLSAHSRGCAVDINPKYNPYVKKSSNGKLLVRPATSNKYLQRTETFDYKLEKGDLCYRLFTERGFKWGGNWRSAKDYQHFEK